MEKSLVGRGGKNPSKTRKKTKAGVAAKTFLQQNTTQSINKTLHLLYRLKRRRVEQYIGAG